MAEENQKQGLKEYEPNDAAEMVDFLEAKNPRDLAEFVRKLQAGEKITKTFSLYASNTTDTRMLQAYVEALRQEGIDIGREDSQYGFKTPLPQKGDNRRDLIIFRRK